MKDKILAIIYILIALFMIFMTCIPHKNTILNIINGVFIGHVCMLAYLRVKEY